MAQNLNGLRRRRSSKAKQKRPKLRVVPGDLRVEALAPAQDDPDVRLT
jgi:hypothetical protein